jgi:pseudouridine-5'-phosphate glycosidase
VDGGGAGGEDVLAEVVGKVAVDKVAVGKVAAEAAVARVAGAADLPAVVAEWEVEAAVVDAPVVAGAAATVSPLSSGGASRLCGAPFFC